MREVNVWGIWRVAANSFMMLVASIMLWWTDWRLFLSVAWLASLTLIGLPLAIALWNRAPAITSLARY